MLRKSLIGAVAVLGIALAGSVASAQPASAGYACGPWNGYCGYFLYPGWGWGWIRPRQQSQRQPLEEVLRPQRLGQRLAQRQGQEQGQAYKNGNWNKYH